MNSQVWVKARWRASPGKSALRNGNGPNDDVFVFDVRSGNDIINDFNRGNLIVGSTATEHDVIDVRAYGLSDWNALQQVISEWKCRDPSLGYGLYHPGRDHTADLHQTDFII